MRIRKHVIMAAVIILSHSVWAAVEVRAAENEALEHRGQGYAFFAPGAIVFDGYRIGTLHIGGGGEALIYKGIGIGGEMGYFAPWRELSNGAAILSLDGSYRFNRDRKLSPFVSGGCSLGIRNGYGRLVNFGGGVNYWFRDKIGIRLEFRDFVDRGGGQLISGRIGISFR